MIHFIRQGKGQGAFFLKHTYIYSTECDVGAPAGYVRVKFINDERAIDVEGNVYDVHRFTRHVKSVDI